MSRNGSLPSCSFSKVNLRAGCRRLSVTRKSSTSPSCLKMATELGFETSVYRKPTFSGQYIRWESFSPRKRKTNPIATLVHRALVICTKNKLKQEIDFIKKILLDNGYPEDIVLKHTSKKIAQSSTAKPFGPKKCPVYLRAP